MGRILVVCCLSLKQFWITALIFFLQPTKCYRETLKLAKSLSNPALWTTEVSNDISVSICPSKWKGCSTLKCNNGKVFYHKRLNTDSSQSIFLLYWGSMTVNTGKRGGQLLWDPCFHSSRNLLCLIFDLFPVPLTSEDQSIKYWPYIF